MTVDINEIEAAIRRERDWSIVASKAPDKGDCTEGSGPDHITAFELVKAYRNLVDALLKRQRS